ncbi:MAG: hypothetical protein ACTSVV_15450 [Promethearchaeota archaeon]
MDFKNMDKIKIKIMDDGIPAIVLPPEISIIPKSDYRYRGFAKRSNFNFRNSFPTRFRDLFKDEDLDDEF